MVPVHIAARVGGPAHHLAGFIADSSLTLTAGGLVTIAIPETASFYALLTTGVNEISLFHSFRADQAG